MTGAGRRDHNTAGYWPPPMRSKQSIPRTIDQYIAAFPKEVQATLAKIRATIRRAAPAAEERISYHMPAFFLEGKPLIFFAAYKKHIGLYPAPRGTEEFKRELADHAGGKGTVQLPLDRALPLDLIRRMVKFRSQAIRQKAATNAAQQIKTKTAAKSKRK